MMNLTAYFALASNDRSQQEPFRAIALPYQAGSIEMIVVLPDKLDGLTRLETGINIDMLNKLFARLNNASPQEVQFVFPKFKITFGIDLIPTFKAEGMNSAFSPSLADFGGITGKANMPGLIWISQIVHKSFVEVNEKGTKAAAATAVEFRTKSLDIGPLRFRVDHPFLFLIVDRPTNTILFMGTVRNPVKTE
jgi:serpin B